MNKIAYAVKIALGIAIISIPMQALPLPVADSSEILAEYKKEYEQLLAESGETEEETVAAFKELFYSDEMNTRDGIESFAEWVGGQDNALDVNPFPLFHTFNDGVYTREIHMPKGYAVVGRLHKKGSVIYMLKGKAFVADENHTRTIRAPAKFICKGGVKRMLYILEDTIWLDIHATDKTTIEEAEMDIFAESYEELTNMRVS